MQRLFAERLVDLGRTDVRRDREDLGHVEPAFSLGVANGVLGRVLPAAFFTEESLIGANRTLLERGGDGDRLERRAGS